MPVLSKAYFHDEAAAFAHVEAMLWANGRVCPHCGTVDNSYPLKNQRSKPTKKSPEGVERHGLYKCGACRSQFTVRIGTIFEESHLPLHKWLQAIHLVCSSRKGISAHQLHRTLEVQYKTARFLAHRIREAMTTGGLSPMGGEGKVVRRTRPTRQSSMSKDKESAQLDKFRQAARELETDDSEEAFDVKLKKVGQHKRTDPKLIGKRIIPSE